MNNTFHYLLKLDSKLTTTHFLKEYDSKYIKISKEDFHLIESFSTKYFTYEFVKEENREITCKVKMKYFIGIVSISPTLKFVISPKIDNANFLSMLEYIDPSKIKVWEDLVSGLDKEQNYIELFISKFLNQTEQLLKKSLIRGYDLQIVNSQSVKGKILFKTNFRNLYLNNFKHYCLIHEYNANTIHNQLIKRTLMFIRRIVPQGDRKLYKKLLLMLEGVENKIISNQQIHRMSYNRLTYNYKPVHDICYLILNDFSFNFKSGESHFFSFVINSWNIFELFLRNIYFRFQQKWNVNPYNIDHISDDTDWENKVNLRPDIILESLSDVGVMIDAKYKFVSGTHVQSDYFQIITYLTQYLHHNNETIQYGELIYPKFDASDKDLIIDQNQTVLVRFIDLSQIDNERYLEEFVLETLSNYEIYSNLVLG